MPERRTDVRNVAIIAHVDHGKTTLVDQLLMQSGTLHARGEVQDCIMDSNDQERERGITILSKVCAVDVDNIRINIIDTPGHADFGGEVERVVKMADGCLLLVDAFEGPMPQTRYVLRKALENGLKPVLVVNKVDKDGARPEHVVNMVFDLMVDLNAEDWQLDFPIVYGSGREGWMVRDLEAGKGGDLRCLFDIIINDIPGPPIDPDAPLKLQVTNLDYNDYVGRIAIGRVFSGSIEAGQQVVIVKGPDGIPHKARVLQLHKSKGLSREEIKHAEAGDVVQVTGLEGIDISDTICHPDHPTALPPIPIDEPTIRMTIGVTTSPLAGLEGKPLQSRDLRARLSKECERNVALRFADTPQPDVFEVSGRGLLHLSVLIETMRREGSELQVGPPRVIFHEDEHGKRTEPIELAVVDVPEEHSSKVVNLMLERRGELLSMGSNGKLQHLEFTIPSRGLIGLRTLMLTATQGEATLSTVFHEYGAYRGDLQAKRNGVMIAMGPGEAVAFAIYTLQDRGEFFLGVNAPLYEGLVVGLNSKDTDMIVNLTKGKKLTNVRSSGADDAIKLTPPQLMTLEEALEFIATDELVEVTPKSIRVRKAMLKEVDRKRASRG
ncbi:MAG: translational GTPase TypA [Planctomycetota bacterium]|jgi:GTP-binding protein|nr:translational GTPase TypA [Planctomycetota bacterium]